MKELIEAFTKIFLTITENMPGEDSLSWLAVFGILCWLIASQALDKKAALEERRKMLEHIMQQVVKDVEED